MSGIADLWHQERGSAVTEESNEVLALQIKHLKEALDAQRFEFEEFKKAYNANVRNGVWVILIAAGAVLFEPFRVFWAAVQSR